MTAVTSPGAPRERSRRLTYAQVIAANVRSARARGALDQDVVAERMNALGYKWYRATVSAVEKEKRRVSAEEVFPLSLALEVPIMRLMWAQDYQVVVLPNGTEVQGALITASASRTDMQDVELVEWDDGVPWFSRFRESERPSTPGGEDEETAP